MHQVEVERIFFRSRCFLLLFSSVYDSTLLVCCYTKSYFKSSKITCSSTVAADKQRITVTSASDSKIAKQKVFVYFRLTNFVLIDSQGSGSDVKNVINCTVYCRDLSASKSEFRASCFLNNCKVVWRMQ